MSWGEPFRKGPSALCPTCGKKQGVYIKALKMRPHHDLGRPCYGGTVELVDLIPSGPVRNYEVIR